MGGGQHSTEPRKSPNVKSPNEKSPKLKMDLESLLRTKSPPQALGSEFIALDRVVRLG